MRIAVAISLVLIGFAWPGLSATASAQAPEKQWNQTARRDRETRIFVFYAYDTISPTLCRNYGLPPLKLIEPPRNGTARIDETEYTPKGCPNPLKATGIFYRPNPGFAGTDRFTVEKGPQGRMAYTVAEGINIFNVTVK